jgi:hypothetical protein
MSDDAKQFVGKMSEKSGTQLRFSNDLRKGSSSVRVVLGLLL